MTLTERPKSLTYPSKRAITDTKKGGAAGTANRGQGNVIVVKSSPKSKFI